MATDKLNALSHKQVRVEEQAVLSKAVAATLPPAPIATIPLMDPLNLPTAGVAGRLVRPDFAWAPSDLTGDTRMPYLERYVLPEIYRPLEEPTFFACEPDVRAALALLAKHRSVRVKAWKHLHHNLTRDPLFSIPPSLRNRKENEYSRASARWAEAQSQVQFVAKEHNFLETEEDVADFWFKLLVPSLNACVDPGMGKPYNAKWEKSDNSTEWIVKEANGLLHGCLKWRMGVSTDTIVNLSTYAAQDFGYGYSKGFEISERRGHVKSTDTRAIMDPVLVALLAWSTAHFNKTRWCIIFNGDVAILVFLAQQNVIYVSSPIYRNAGESGVAMTLPLAMAAMARTVDPRHPFSHIVSPPMKYHKKVKENGFRMMLRKLF